MSDYTKFNFEKESVINNNESRPGGFFPIGENNFWHGGIHLYGDNLKPLYITPIENGEIIACRITEDFEKKSDELDPLFIECEINEVKTSNNSTVNELINKAFIKDDSDDEGRNDYIINENAELTPEENDLLKHVFNTYSNNFVLLRHSIKIQDQDIIYYSLYMHLLPWNYYHDLNPSGGYPSLPVTESNEKNSELVRPFFRKWTFEVTGNEFEYGLRTINGRFIPPYSYIYEELNENNTDLRRDGQNIIMTSRSFDFTGPFPDRFPSKVIQERIFYLEKNISIYYDSTLNDYKGKISNEVCIIFKNIRGETFDDFLPLEYMKNHHSIEVYFDWNDMSVRELEGYILDEDGSEDYAEHESLEDVFTVKASRLFLYDLDTAVKEIERLRSNNEFDEIQKINLNNYIRRDDKLYFDDNFCIEIPDIKILSHFPNAKKVILRSTDASAGSFSKGWISPAQMRIKSGRIYKNHVVSDYPGISMRNTDMRGLLVREIPNNIGPVFYVLREGDKFEAVNLFNNLSDIEDEFLLVQFDDGDEQKTGYVKIRSLNDHCSIIKENIENISINTNSSDVCIFDKPIPVRKKETILGVPGKMEFQNNMFHFELFFKDDSILNLDSSAEKSHYLFKKGSQLNFKTKKEEMENIGLSQGCVLKKISDVTNDIIEAETYCDYEEVIVNRNHFGAGYSNSIYTFSDNSNMNNEIPVYNIITNENNIKSIVELSDKKAFVHEGLTGVFIGYIENFKNENNVTIPYRRVKFPVILSEGKSTGFLKRTEFLNNFSFFGTEYIKLNEDNLQWYIKNPNIFEEDTEISKNFDEKEVVRSNRINILDDESGAKWVGFYFEEDQQHRRLWMQETELMNNDKFEFLDAYQRQNAILNLYHINNFFNIFEEGNTGKDKDGICDVVELLSNVGLSIDNGELTDTLKFGDVKAVFENEVKDSDGSVINGLKVKDYLKKSICKIPTEWEDMDDNKEKKDLTENRLKASPYYMTDQTLIDKYFEQVKKLSWFTAVKNKYGLGTNLLIFAHPIEVFNHFSYFSKSYNPFEGEIVEVNSTRIDGNNQEIDFILKEKVIDNPGVGIVIDIDGNLKEKNNYVRPNGLFNEDYTVYYSNYRAAGRRRYHEGVDFDANVNNNNEIVMFITGKIKVAGVATGIKSKIGIGRFIVIQDVENTEKFYVLCHLEKILTAVDKIVYPGELVAIAGNTGNSTGHHLHISLFKFEDEDFNRAFRQREDGFYTVIFGNNHQYMFNPFNHNQTWNYVAL